MGPDDKDTYCSKATRGNIHGMPREISPFNFCLGHPKQSTDLQKITEQEINKDSKNNQQSRTPKPKVWNNCQKFDHILDTLRNFGAQRKVDRPLREEKDAQ